MNGVRSDLSQADIAALLDYEPRSGNLVWKSRPLSNFPDERACAIWNTRYAGKIAGGIQNNGYRKVAIGSYPYMAHRLIWVLVHGVLPDDIDHIDGNRDNNRLANLRNVSRAENLKNMKLKANSSSGVTGVTRAKGGKWLAYIRVNYQRIDLGRFAAMEDAIACRKAAEITHGFHVNHGRAA